MALVKTFDAHDLKMEFQDWNRDYFSYTACEELIELFEQDPSDTELDIVALCCDFTEQDWEDIKSEYDNHDDIAECESKEELLEVLNEYTWAVETEDDMILYQVW